MNTIVFRFDKIRKEEEEEEEENHPKGDTERKKRVCNGIAKPK